MHSDGLRAWVEIDIAALVRNARALARQSGARLLPMVKADAYGLGAVPVARALTPLHPWGFGVATVEEGLELRAAGIAARVVVFTPALPREFPVLISHGLTPALGVAEHIAEWTSLGDHAWHLAVETGMNRAGVQWNAVASLESLLRAAPPEGAFTHFHSPERNDGSMQRQEERFVAAVSAMPGRPGVLHAENSAAVARRRESTWDLIRPGIFLYGVGSGAGALLQPEPVVSVRARLVELHYVPAGETVSYLATYRATEARKIGTTAIGYADGYRRIFSNLGSAEVNGRRATVAGLVTMDMTMLDVTEIECAAGDVATFASGTGGETGSIESLCTLCDLSPYEFLTGLRQRLPRVYTGEG